MLDNLIIDLENKEVTINGYNSAFEGTPFYGKEFEIVVDPISHKEYDRIRNKYTNRRKNTTDEAAMEKELFMRQVINWSNIKDPSGKEILCTDEIKEMISDKIFFFARAVNVACLNARLEISGEEEKN